ARGHHHVPRGDPSLPRRAAGRRGPERRLRGATGGSRDQVVERHAGSDDPLDPMRGARAREPSRGHRRRRRRGGGDRSPLPRGDPRPPSGEPRSLRRPMIDFLMIPGAPPPPPTAPYSHAVRAGDHLFVTGQLGADPVTGRLVSGGIAAETHQVMRNLQAVLAGAGTSLERAVFARVYLVNFADYPVMNAIYASYFA